MSITGYVHYSLFIIPASIFILIVHFFYSVYSRINILWFFHLIVLFSRFFEASENFPCESEEYRYDWLSATVCNHVNVEFCGRDDQIRIPDGRQWNYFVLPVFLWCRFPLGVFTDSAQIDRFIL